MPGSEQTEGILQLTQYLKQDTIDLIGDYNEDMRKIAEYAQTQNQKEGVPNGYATLDSNGRLIQMPTAEEVGARPSNWLPSASEIGAQDKTSARNAIIKADSSGNLVEAIPNKDYGALVTTSTVKIHSGLTPTAAGEIPYFVRNGNLGLLTFNLTAKQNISAWSTSLSFPSGTQLVMAVRGVCLVGPSGGLSPKPFYIYKNNPPNAQLETAIPSGNIIMGCIPIPLI